MRLDDIPEISQLSVSDKILLMEELWNSIAVSLDKVSLTKAQQEELDLRLEKYQLDPEAGSLWEMELDKKDRYIISNQLKILEKLYPEESDYYRKDRMIVEHGYELDYDSLVEHFHRPMDKPECLEVIDVLDMYRVLYLSFKELSDKKDLKIEDVQFKGFDGNDGSGRFGYCRFLILEDNRWQEVLEGRPNFSLNSHSEVNEQYNRMLIAWKRLDKKYKLSYEEIKKIINERIHPEFR